MPEGTIEQLDNADDRDWDRAQILPGNRAASAVLAVRLSAAEFEDLASAAERSGITVTEFARRAALSASRAD